MLHFVTRHWELKLLAIAFAAGLWVFVMTSKKTNVVVALPLELGSMRARDAREAARDALAQVGLEERAREYPAELSGGAQQRVAIARALIGDRTLLLADEPTGSLDSLAAEAVMGLIRRRCDGGTAAIVATHDARHAALADRVIYLRDGAIVGESSLADGLVGSTLP